MKKLIIPLFAIIALTLTAGAQDKLGNKRHHQKHQKGMMAKKLGLTEDQKKQAKTINDDTRKQMQALKKNENITVKTMRDRKAAIQQEKRKKMDALLTPDQKATAKQLKEAHKTRAEEGYTKRLDKMKSKLDLSDEQVSKLKNQRSANRAKAEKIRNNGSLTREQKKEQMMALKTEAKEQNKKIFTAEQLKKKDEMRKNYSGKSRAVK